MNTYTGQFYDLLYSAFRGDTSAKRLQGYLDEVMASKYNGLQLDGFQFAPDMQIDFTYEQVQKELGLTAMANYYDLDSPAIPRGNEGVTLITGKIPRMKDVEYINEDKVRKQLLVERLNGANSDAAVDAAKNRLFVTLDDLIGGHTNSLTYQRHQMVSAGKLTINNTNNPKGIQGVTFSASVPSANKNTLTGAAKWWTDTTYATEGANAAPADDLRAMVETAKKRGIRGHFEVNTSYMDKVLSHSKVLAVIGMNLLPLGNSSQQAAAASYAARAQKVEILSSIVGAPIKEIDSLVAVEVYDKSIKALKKDNISAFESNVIVFVPDGNLGEVLTVMPIAFESASAKTAYFYGGRLMLTVDGDAVKKCQGFYTEMTSLVVPEVPQYMWYLYPNNA